MQSNIDVVRSFFIAIDQSKLERAGQFLADDFRKYRPAAESLGKQEYLGVFRALKAAMPDLSHILSNITSEGAIVRLTIQAGGRHINGLSLPDLRMGLPAVIVPGSGRMIIFLPNQFEYTVVNGSIHSERDVTPSTLFNGAAGFLSALDYSS